MTTITQARAEVETLAADIVEHVATGELGRLHDLERELWTRLLAFGRALVALYLARWCARPRPADHIIGGARYMDSGQVRRREIGTLFGKVTFDSPLARRVDDLRARAHQPVAHLIGLAGGFSRTVVLGMARLAAMMPLGTARDFWRETYGWAPAPRSIQRMIDAVGDEARPFLEAAPAPADDGEILVIQVDAGGAPMISDAEYALRTRPHATDESGTRRKRRRAKRKERPQKPRRKGKKSKNAKMAFVFAIYTLRHTDDGLGGPIDKRIYATFESHEAAFEWAKAEAIKRGMEYKQVVFIADGSEHIWERQQRFFPDATVCLDFWHAAEYIWKVSTCFAREGTRAQRAWVAAQKERMRHDRIDEVIAELRAKLAATPKTGPGNKGRREKLAQAAEYFDKNRERMMYGTLRDADLDIASGVIEGAVRNLVRMRFDGPGMRWGRTRAEKLLHLRCILLNGQWGAFAESLFEADEFKLKPQPERARAHTAKPVPDAA